MIVNDAVVLEEITEVFARYELALVSNDVDELDRLFWNSDMTVRYGVAENLYGFSEIAAFRAGRSALGLNRDIVRSVITCFGSEFATTSIEFARASGVRGRRSQCWVKMPEGWRVVAAHVSLLAAT